MKVVSDRTWEALVRCSHAAEVASWASPGVFMTAVGPAYAPGATDSLFYVGKAGGPRIDGVGLSDDRDRSGAVSANWMIGRRNPSAFWKFADLLSDRREQIAWSNVAKIDNRLATPPRRAEWELIREPCLEALAEEMLHLRPKRTVLAIGSFCTQDVTNLLQRMSFDEFGPMQQLEDARCFKNRDGQLVVLTRHPQGWRTVPRNAVARFVRTWRC